jgi:hypothetical protein
LSFCLFCQSETEQFLHDEHIIPESLGNRTYVLPKGIVCDKCNNYFAKLDNYFCHYHLAATHKLFGQYKTKKGNPPSMLLKKGEARQGKNGDIKFNQRLVIDKGSEQMSLTFAGLNAELRFQFSLPDSDSKKISRFLAKAGMEILYLKKRETAFNAEFDNLRKYARYGNRHGIIPFLYCYQQSQEIKLDTCTLDSKKYGRFFFGIIFLPGIIYLIPLNRTTEDYGMVFMQKFVTFSGNKLHLCNDEGLIKRSPINISFQFEAKQKMGGNGNEGQLSLNAIKNIQQSN